MEASNKSSLTPISRFISSMTSGFVIIAVLQFSPTAHAAKSVIVDDGGSDVQGYDSIVNELTRETDRPVIKAKGKSIAVTVADPFDAVIFHSGVGLSTVAQSLSFDNGKQAYLGQKGLQLSFGIDLFSPNLMAEGTYRSFSESADQAVKVSLQEFEMKFFYKDHLTPQIGYRAGGGLSARYMNVHENNQSPITYTTPSGVGTFGLDFFFNDKFSFGVDVSGRSAMITETPDKNSVDATLRMDAHF